ncbi:MAG: helix-turn-helix domain-containing protein [Bdellovibrionaceae bacterium]|jgi:HTH-type transcriptional regulator/antitoxin HigA|nr:helix-turn-helix domain-containing protein [Pseudobdellovibrionaceae bacterium]
MGAQLITYFEKFPLIPIRSNSQYQKAKAVLRELLFDPGAKDYVETLILLIKNYEEKQFYFQKPSPEAMLRFLMQQRGLKQKDLAGVLGSQSNVSEILRGKRKLNLNHIRKLAKFFNVSVETFV